MAKQFSDPGSSSSSSSPLWDVFLSFRGTDTRRNFISHLLSALDQAGIATFKDDPQLRKGEEISSGLVTAIHASAISLVVISENYAFSSWCLDELVEILFCKRTNGQVVIPVFCYVDPSNVRYQKGKFGEAFEKHNKRYSLDIVDKWKSALVEIAKMSGYHLKKDTDEEESTIIQKIVAEVGSQPSTNVRKEHLFGMDSAVEDIYQKLRMESNDVRALGIWGMGGIGKTTTAKTFFDRYSKEFDISCFVEDMKQNSKGGITLLGLIEKLLIKLGSKKNCKVSDSESGIRRLQNILSSKTALIVLDDFDESSYWKLLVELCNSFLAGSRIIVTTRDENLINKLKVQISEVDMYKLNELGEEESLELFSYHAFGKTMATKVLSELAMNILSYAGGLPLALKVLGSSLCGRTSVSFWRDKLKKLQQIPDNDIQKVLQLSYEELNDEEKAIFLDVVFFFVGKEKDEAVHIFSSCDFFPDMGVPILVGLLTIDGDNKFGMHNLIQDMGMVVIREEFKHGKCRHLSLGDTNPCKALQNLKEADKIEALILDVSMATNKQVDVKIFEKLPKLRLLEIIGACNMKGNFKNMFPELRCIRWHYCPATCLPSDLRPHKLVFLDMPHSEFTTLWKGAMSLVNLKIINVSYSKHLKTTPNFGNAKRVEKLSFHGCTSLEKVHPTIGELTNLVHLDFDECNQLIDLPKTIEKLTKLDHLNLSARWSGIEQLPESITRIKGLADLHLYGCRNLKKLPEEFGKLEGLKHFNAGATALEELPESFECLNNLLDIDLSCCKNLIYLPDGIWKLKMLQALILEYCSKLKRVPEDIGKMQSLEVLNAGSTAIEKLPDSIGQLGSIRFLCLNYCKRLTCLPDSIGNLSSLESLLLQGSGRINFPNTVKNMKLLRLTSSTIGLCLPVIPSLSSLKELYLSDEDHEFSSTKPFSLSKLLNLKIFECKYFRSSLPELPLNLKELRVEDHSTLEQLPDLTSYKHLKSLYLRRCISLQSLSLLPPHLDRLLVCACKRLQNPPDLSLLKELTYLYVAECGNLKSFSFEESPLAPSF